MSRYFRYLRVAFSVTCSIACVLLIKLWIQNQENIAAGPYDVPFEPIPDFLFVLPFGLFFVGMFITAYSVLREIRWRFRLRTLLIVTTLVAVISALAYYIKH